MANRGIVDDSVIERRLRPIYDWLDNGNNKKAMQEADKVLRKQPKLHCAKVLKALALLRLGKNSECLELIDAVVNDGISDEPTLQALTICYREMHQPEQICSIYERAVKLDPNNEEIISHLFMAHVRVGDYKKQQLTAMQLYKLKPKNPYYFWAVMSIVMQSQVAKDPAAKNVCLQLAERMVSKFISQNKIDSEAEIMTYLYILEIQEKYTEALEVLNGTLVHKIVHQPQNFICMKKATYHSKLGQYDASSIMYMNLIRHELDNWQHYVNFTETVIRMHEESMPNLVGQADPLLEASKFLQEIRSKGLKNFENARSPLLGIMQYALQLREKGLNDKIKELCGDIEEQFFEYAKYYSDRMCCYGDVVIFIPLIHVDSRPAMLQKVKNLISFDKNVIPIDIKNIYRHQFYFQLMKSFGLQDSFTAANHLTLADELIGFYNNSTHLWSDMADTDIRPNDTYMILAAHSIFAAFPELITKTENQENVSSPTQLMLKLCCLLEHGIEISNANFQMKLLLIKAYNMIGASEVAFTVYENLDLKHIQMDTLGHILSLQILETGRYSIADNIFSNTLKFFMANHKDTSDPLILSYKFGSLVKIPEFVEFRHRLNNSLHFATVTTEQLLLELTTPIECTADLSEAMKVLAIDHSRDKTDWDSLKDNRDLNVMTTWEPQERKCNSEIKEETFKGGVVILKIRNLMFRFLAASYHLRNEEINLCNKMKSLTNGDSNGTCDNDALTELHVKLHEQTEVCDKYSKLEPLRIPLQGPDNSRIFEYSKGRYFPCFLEHADVLHFIHRCTDGIERWDNWSEDRFSRISEHMDTLISNQFSHLGSFQVDVSAALPNLNNVHLNHMWHFAQTLSFVVILLENCNALLLPIKNTIQKKNKKKKSNTSLPDIIPCYNGYVVSLLRKLKKFEASLSDKVNISKNLHQANKKSKYHDFRVEVPIRDFTVDVANLSERIEDSFLQSLTTIHSLLKAKIKFLTGLQV